MEQDHYQMLGVPPTATIDEIKRAYRKRTLECHPDRGGSHAEMIRINAAWEILSEPEMRRTHDQAQTGQDVPFAQRAAEVDAARATEHAANYPRRWKDFEGWLDRVTGDFTSAEYGKADLMWGMTSPTVRNSVSGTVFAAMGGLFAFIAFVYVLAHVLKFPKGPVVSIIGLVRCGVRRCLDGRKLPSVDRRRTPEKRNAECLAQSVIAGRRESGFESIEGRIRSTGKSGREGLYEDHSLSEVRSKTPPAGTPRGVAGELSDMRAQVLPPCCFLSL